MALKDGYKDGSLEWNVFVEILARWKELLEGKRIETEPDLNRIPVNLVYRWQKCCDRWVPIGFAHTRKEIFETVSSALVRHIKRGDPCEKENTKENLPNLQRRLDSVSFNY